MRDENQIRQNEAALSFLYSSLVRTQSPKNKKPVFSLHLYSREQGEENTELPLFAGKRNSSLVDISLDEPVSPKRLRVIRPLPRSRQNLHTPVNQLRSQLYGQGAQCGLGSPFHSG